MPPSCHREAEMRRALFARGSKLEAISEQEAGERCQDRLRLWIGNLDYTGYMTATAEQLLQQILSLGERDRASIAGALIESLESAEPGVQEAWEPVIQRRVEELDAGTVKTVPWSEVREQLFCWFE